MWIVQRDNRHIHAYKPCNEYELPKELKALKMKCLAGNIIRKSEHGRFCGGNIGVVVKFNGNVK